MKRANPASWITRDGLREQKRRVTSVEWAQFHACVFGVGEGAWLPPGAWSACRGPVDLTPREVFLGIDIGGTRAASALVGVTEDLQVPIVRVFHGDEAVLEVTRAVVELAEAGWTIRVLNYDPWRYHAEALRLRDEHGLAVAEFPQSDLAHVPATEGLHAAIVEDASATPATPSSTATSAAAWRSRRRGAGAWTRSDRPSPIDAVVALAMAVESARRRPEPLRGRLGWLIVQSRVMPAGA